MDNQELIPFEGKEIRKIWHHEEWYFSVVDVVEFLTDSKDPKRYWSVLKTREFQGTTICSALKLTAIDGRKRLTDCANTKGILRIIMSIPSPKAEPFKLWLAQVGTEVLSQYEQKRLLRQEQIAFYKVQGRSDEWIEKRIDNIEKRNKLTDEWKERGVKEGQEYSILTATIAKGTFGLTPSEHKKLKGLDKPSQDLRDNMTELELLFTSLGEVLTRQETIKTDAQGFDENKTAAIKGGYTAGEARKRVEEIEGIKIVSAENFLPPPKTAPPTT